VPAQFQAARHVSGDLVDQVDCSPRPDSQREMAIRRQPLARRTFAYGLPPPQGPAPLPVIVCGRDACWVFDVIPAPHQAGTARAAGLPPALIVAAADGLSGAGAAIASALEVVGLAASEVTFRGILDDFIPVTENPDVFGRGLPRHARRPSGSAGRHRLAG